MRGSRRAHMLLRDRNGSIPAHAGEPWPWTPTRSSNTSAGFDCRTAHLEEAVISSEEAASVFDAAEKVAAGRPNLGDDGRYQLDCSRVAFERSVADDEIDLDSGFLIIPKALPAKPVEPTSTTSGAEPGTDETG